MRTSEQVEKIFPALVKAQHAAKSAIKDSTNPHFRSKYADLGSVWLAVSDALKGSELAIIQAPGEVLDGKLHITTRIIHTSGQWLETVASTPLPKADPQGYGSAVTYLRRYTVSALLGVVADEDDDGNAASHAPSNTGPDTQSDYSEMASKYAGKCALCGVDYPKGEKIVYSFQKKKGAHVNCFKQRGQSEAA